MLKEHLFKIKENTVRKPFHDYFIDGTQTLNKELPSTDHYLTINETNHLQISFKTIIKILRKQPKLSGK